MFDEGNSQLSAVGFFNPMLGGGDAVSAFGGGGGIDLSPCFNISGNKIINCGIAFGSVWVTCDDTELNILEEGNDPIGVIYAEVKHNTSTPVLSVKHNAQGLPWPELDVTCRTLYQASSDKRWIDFRYIPAIFAFN